MWETVENFQNKLIINEFCRTQFANNPELLWQSNSPKYNRVRLERKGEWGETEQEKRAGKRDKLRREEEEERKDVLGIQSILPAPAPTLYLVGTWLHKTKPVPRAGGRAHYWYHTSTMCSTSLNVSTSGLSPPPCSASNRAFF